jgi:hypothetical protein
MALESDTDGMKIAPAIVPQSYTVAASTLTVTFQNVGTGPARQNMGDLSPYLALDAGGQPLWFAFLKATATTDLPVGGQGMGQDGTLDPVAECATGVHAFISFRNAASSAALLAGDAPALAGRSLSSRLDAVSTWRARQAASIAALRLP